MNANTLKPARRETIFQSLIVFFIFLSIDVIVFRDWLQMLYPLGDEFSLIVESRQVTSQWLFDGYSHYFTVYPEFFEPFTNFIRPVANGVYWLFSPWTAAHYRLQLILVNYGVHAAIAATCYFLGVTLENSKKYSFGLALVAFLAPAFWASEMPIFPSFALDGLAALFCLVGTYLLVTRFHWVGLIFFILAVFTKETALPIVAAVFVYSLLVRRVYLGVSALLILSLWAGVRFIAFGKFIGGTYSLNGIGGFLGLASRFYAFFLMPVGYTTAADIKAFVFERVFSGSLLFCVINSIFWILFLLLVKRLCPPGFSTSNFIMKLRIVEKISPRMHFWVLSLLGVVGSAVFFITIVGGGEARFTYVFLVCLLGVLSSAFPQIRERGYILFLLVGAFSVVGLLSISKLTETKNMYAMYYDASRALVNKLRAIGTQDRRVVVVNDPIGGFSKQNNIAKFAGMPGELIRGSSIRLDECRMEDVRSISTTLENISLNDKILKIDIPTCAKFEFEGANPKLVLANLEGSHLKRNNYTSYLVPEIRLGRTKVAGIEYVEDFGKTMTIRIKDSAVLYFDFGTKEWVYLP